MAQKLIQLKSASFLSEGRLSEIYSSINKVISYQVVNLNKNEIITPKMKCKDYINDIFYSVLKQKDVSIYGFSLLAKDVKDFDIMNDFSLFITPPVKRNCLEKIVNFIEPIEKHLKLEEFLRIKELELQQKLLTSNHEHIA